MENKENITMIFELFAGVYGELAAKYSQLELLKRSDERTIEYLRGRVKELEAGDD